MSLDSDQMLAVLDALPDPVFVLDPNGRYLDLYGYADPDYYHDGHDLVGKRVHEVMPFEPAQWILQQITRALREQRLIKVEYPLAATQVKGLEQQPGPDGMLWFEGHIQPFPGLIEGEKAVIWVARNITARKELEAELLEASQTDPLTRVSNRRKLMETLEKQYAIFRRYHNPTSLIMLDIDHFKQLNDRFGHLAGDSILRNLCDSCRRILRENDLLARFGGEEFVIVLPNTRSPQALSTAERIRTEVPAAVALKNGQEKAFTLSLGVSEINLQDTHFEQVLKRVDTALYKAKNSGRNRVEISFEQPTFSH